jgi:hypothetical protein
MRDNEGLADEGVLKLCPLAFAIHSSLGVVESTGARRAGAFPGYPTPL